ncbi:ORF28 [white sturgeon herpesvirus 2]|uniref:ORF28 n=1 Tax=white sturgeon herpesvirus 2 TaxID=320884 RepID=F6GQ67_9VIRU|nr:ORF28 [Acipenserid herpesvirus 2]AEF97687.1 ORF28 [Acipenserid herpesvirus 2]
MEALAKKGASKIDQDGAIWVMRPDQSTGVYNPSLTAYTHSSPAEFEKVVDKQITVPQFCDKCFGKSSYVLPSLYQQYKSFVVGTCCIFSDQKQITDTQIPGDLTKATIDKYQQPLNVCSTMTQRSPGDFKYAHEMSIGTVLGYWHVHKQDQIYLNVIAGLNESELTKRCISTFKNSFENSVIPCGLSLGTGDIGFNEVILECSLVVVPARKGCFAKLTTSKNLSATLESFCFKPHTQMCNLLLASFGTVDDIQDQSNDDIEAFYKTHIESLNNYIKLLKLVYAHKGETVVEQYLKDGETIHQQLIGEPPKILSANMQVNNEQPSGSGAPGNSQQQSSMQQQGTWFNPPPMMQATQYPHPGFVTPMHHLQQFHSKPSQGFSAGAAYNGYQPVQIPPVYSPYSMYGNPMYPGFMPNNMHSQYGYQHPPQYAPRHSEQDINEKLMESLGLKKKDENLLQDGLRTLINSVIESHLGEKKANKRSHDSDEFTTQPLKKHQKTQQQDPIETIVSTPFGQRNPGVEVMDKITDMSSRVSTLTETLLELVKKGEREKQPHVVDQPQQEPLPPGVNVMPPQATASIIPPPVLSPPSGPPQAILTASLPSQSITTPHSSKQTTQTNFLNLFKM